MPTYDYECDACGHTFEIWQSFKDDTLTKCPECKKNKLRRLFGGGAAIIFKGSGFYDTDYRQKDEAKKNGKSKAEAEPKVDTESKPAAGTEAKADTPAASSSKPDGGTTSTAAKKKKADGV